MVEHTCDNGLIELVINICDWSQTLKSSLSDDALSDDEFPDDQNFSLLNHEACDKRILYSEFFSVRKLTPN